MRAHLDHTAEELAWREEHFQKHRRFMGKLAADHPRTVSPLSYPCHGNDLSSYQQIGQFQGKAFDAWKASEATTYADPHFAGNRAAANGAAKLIYDFARPSRNNADQEFAKYKSVVVAPRPTEIAVLDYEVPPWDQGFACRWADLAHALGFKYVGIYSYAGMFSSNATDQMVQHFDFIWIAAYSSVWPGWDRWKNKPGFWQHTDGQYGAVDGGTDCSVFFNGTGGPGSLNDLQAWVGGVPVPPPSPPPAPKPKLMKRRLPVQIPN